MSERSCKSPNRQHRSLRATRRALHTLSVLGAATILAGGLSVLSAAVLAGPASATSPSCGTYGTATSPSQCSYTTVGEDTFTVPVGVTSLHVVADAGGGSSSGAQVAADIPVTAGSTEYIEVGVGAAGNGGGLSGIYTCPGGGTTASCALIVGGGGGGSSYFGGGGGGGGSGGVCSNPAGAGYNGGGGVDAYGGSGGGGGTCSSGGGGVSGYNGGSSGSAGSGGGGYGGYGGGGGGYYGGGGGGFNATGGGGSSFVESGAIGTPTFGANGSGSASLTITWTAPPPPTCSPTAPGTAVVPATVSVAGSAQCTINGNATVTGGSLSLAAPASISWSPTDLPYPAYYQANSVGSATALEAIDATGEGFGWSIGLSATQFETTSPPRRAPPDRLRLPRLLRRRREPARERGRHRHRDQ
jgi:hypothetical protein